MTESHGGGIYVMIADGFEINIFYGLFLIFATVVCCLFLGMIIDYAVRFTICPIIKYISRRTDRNS